MAEDTLRYTPQPNIPDDEEGRLKYLSDELNKISTYAMGHNDDLNAHNNLFSVAAYGGIARNTPVAFDITTGWTVLPLDTNLMANPKGVIQNPASYAIQYQYAGVYKLDIGGILQGFAELNAGRTFFVRLYDSTDELPISEDLAVGVGRNTADINFNFSTLVEVDNSALSDGIVVQIGNGDAITGGTLTSGQLSTFMVGEWQG